MNKNNIIIISILIIIICGFIGFIPEKKTVVSSTPVSESKETVQETSVKSKNSVFYDVDYAINIILSKYCEIAEYPLANEYINELKNQKNPYSRYNYHLDNGVKISLSCKELSGHSIIVQISKDDSNDQDLYPVVRDFIKSLNPNVKDDEILNMWNELKSGNYWIDKYCISDIYFNYSKSKLLHDNYNYFVQFYYDE